MDLPTTAIPPPPIQQFYMQPPVTTPEKSTWNKLFLYLCLVLMFIIIMYLSIVYANDVKNRDVRQRRHNLKAYVAYSQALIKKVPHLTKEYQSDESTEASSESETDEDLRSLKIEDE